MKNIKPSVETKTGVIITFAQLATCIAILLSYLALMKYPSKTSWTGDALSILKKMEKWYLLLIIGGAVCLLVLTIILVITIYILIKGKHSSIPLAVGVVLGVLTYAVVIGSWLDVGVFSLLENTKSDMAQIGSQEYSSSVVIFIDPSAKAYRDKKESVPGPYTADNEKLLRITIVPCEEDAPKTFLTSENFRETNDDLLYLNRDFQHKDEIIQDDTVPKYRIYYTENFRLIISIEAESV